MKAINTAGKDSKGNKANSVDPSGNIGSESHKRISLQYQEGNSKAQAQNSEVEGIRDLSTKKPYGRPDMAWASNTGKLGEIPEADQPAWVNTWSECVGGKGYGYTNDENYGVRRPRTFMRQSEAFKEYNPEFQDVADRGDWTSYEWDNHV